MNNPLTHVRGIWILFGCGCKPRCEANPQLLVFLTKFFRSRSAGEITMGQLISLHRRCSLTVAQGFLPWEPGRPGRPGTPKEFVKPSATPSELRIQLRIIPRVGNPGLGLGNTFGVKRGVYRAVDCYQVICCSR